MRFGDRDFLMWAEALALLQGAERPPSAVFTLARLQPIPCWEPSVDLYQDGDQLTVLVALPGVGSHQVQVGLDEDGLIVRGERPMPPACQTAAIHRLEIPYGRFERRVALPPGRFRLQEQLLENGFLVLFLRQSGRG